CQRRGLRGRPLFLKSPKGPFHWLLRHFLAWCPHEGKPYRILVANDTLLQMKICILGDTHNNARSTQAAVTMIREINPKLVIHCGDITSPSMPSLFEGLPMRIVFGNNDWETE